MAFSSALLRSASTCVLVRWVVDFSEVSMMYLMIPCFLCSLLVVWCRSVTFLTVIFLDEMRIRRWF